VSHLGGEDIRCFWCGQNPIRSGPRAPVEVLIRIKATDDKAALAHILALGQRLAATDSEPRLPQTFASTGTIHVSVERRDVTMEQYYAELSEHLRRSDRGLDAEDRPA